jgi:hypothetical protein
MNVDSGLTRGSFRPSRAEGLGRIAFPGLRYARSCRPTDEDLSVGIPALGYFRSLSVRKCIG